MREFATLPQKDRSDALIVAAREKGMHPAIVEKDFWVCWTLDYLFGESAFKDSFAFKGGTSLSKGFNLIERFSEDIDLIFDWRLLGYGIDKPWEKRSNTKQDAFVRQINEDGRVVSARRADAGNAGISRRPAYCQRLAANRRG